MKAAKRLQNTTTLILLNLENNSFGDEAADDITAVLSHNADLQDVFLGGNKLQKAGAIKVAKGLQNATSLTMLDLQNNYFGEDVADDIASSLIRCTVQVKV